MGVSTGCTAGASAGSTGRTLIMPKFIARASLVGIKTAIATKTTSTLAAFYTAIELDMTPYGFDTATLSVSADTTEQTLIDTGTGVTGVLTQVMSPRLSGAGTMTIRVTIDGTVTTFSANITLSSTPVLCIGDFLAWGAGTGTSPVLPGAGTDAGFSAELPLLTFLTPVASVARGLPAGMVFSDSLKITVQGSVNLVAGSTSHKATAAWLTYIPEGLV